MNIILFTESELHKPLFYTDRRYRHIRKILKSNEGDILKAGLINGNRGTVRIEKITADAIDLSFTLDKPTIPLLPIRLVCGLPRPQQAKRILRDCTSMGVSHLWFPQTERGEKSYRHSPIWKNNGWKHCIVEGIEQSGGTMMPDVQIFNDLAECFENLPKNCQCFFLDIDPGESLYKQPSDKPDSISTETILFIGSEKGWSSGERQFLLSKLCVPISLGDRILRTDTACIAAITMALHSF
ncbi:MAG: 16S rRNA (uracil(1498)-N(3))-methyltransferase [bacterium]